MWVERLAESYVRYLLFLTDLSNVQRADEVLAMLAIRYFRKTSLLSACYMRIGGHVTARSVGEFMRFLGAFAKLRKEIISFVMELDCHWTDFDKSLYLRLFFFRKYVEKIQV